MTPLMFFLFQGCSAVPTPMERLAAAKGIAFASGMESRVIHQGKFSILSFYKFVEDDASRHAFIYIEGDGLAYLSRDVISIDPTPYPPLALQLAAHHRDENVIYIARPCQFISSNECTSKWWTSHRFSDEVIDAMNEAISQIVSEFDIKEISLVGYSGGAAIATIIAAKRKSGVRQLITVAGNLDHSKWTSVRNLTSLHGSLNPVDFSDALQNLNQTHLVGLEDSNISPDILQSYLNRMKTQSRVKVYYEHHSHNCCWEKNWDNLLKKYQLRLNEAD